MRSLSLALPGLMCAGSMGLMMWLMMRGQSSSSRGDRNGEQGAGASRAPSAEEEIAQLREEVGKLRAERDQQSERLD